MERYERTEPDGRTRHRHALRVFKIARERGGGEEINCGALEVLKRGSSNLLDGVTVSLPDKTDNITGSINYHCE
jgi:hypothetical protein